MVVEVAFDAELWEHSADPPWHFVTLPADAAEQVRESGPRGGFGSVPVEVELGVTTWRTSVFPDAASGSYLLPVKRPVRRANDLEAGDVVRVLLRVGGA